MSDKHLELIAWVNLLLWHCLRVRSVGKQTQQGRTVMVQARLGLPGSRGRQQSDHRAGKQLNGLLVWSIRRQRHRHCYRSQLGLAEFAEGCTGHRGSCGRQRYVHRAAMWFDRSFHVWSIRRQLDRRGYWAQLGLAELAEGRSGHLGSWGCQRDVHLAGMQLNGFNVWITRRQLGSCGYQLWQGLEHVEIRSLVGEACRYRRIGSTLFTRQFHRRQ